MFVFPRVFLQQAYAEPATGYLQGQPVYSSHQQGVVLQQAGTVTTIVTAPAVQQVKCSFGHWVAPECLFFYCRSQ